MTDLSDAEMLAKIVHCLKENSRRFAALSAGDVRGEGESAMYLEIRSPKANALARELASATGEDIDTAVERAIEERLARVPRELSAEQQRAVDALFDRLARMPVLDPRSPDEIIGFDRHGIPS